MLAGGNGNLFSPWRSKVRGGYTPTASPSLPPPHQPRHRLPEGLDALEVPPSKHLDYHLVSILLEGLSAS